MENTVQVVKILMDHYSLTELEEELGLTPKDLEEGLLTYVDEHFESVSKFLRENLWI